MQGIGLERIMNDKFDARNCVGGCNPMKGLANRYRLTDHFDKALEKCRNHKKLLSVEILYNVKRSQRNSICVKDFCNLEADSKC